VPDSSIELVRRLTDGFSELDFKRFRDALAEADAFDDLAASMGGFGRLLTDVVDPEIEIHLHDIHAASMVGRDFRGERGFLEFWRRWLEPWEEYSVEFTRWEQIRDTVLYSLEIEARGRGSGAVVKDQITQAWTVHDGKVTRLGMYARRSTALADLGHG
jgi:hypothetical protein